MLTTETIYSVAGFERKHNFSTISEAFQELKTPSARKFSNPVRGATVRYQADELGIRYMTKAGCNHWGMAEIPRTHPPADKRIKQAHEIIEKGYNDYSPNTHDPHTS